MPVNSKLNLTGEQQEVKLGELSLGIIFLS